MPQCLNLLEQALDAGERELECLAAGEIESIEVVAQERGRLIEEAWLLRETEQVSVEDLLDKLQKLKSLQGKLSREARTLHSNLAEDLSRIKKQGRRLAGYHRSTKFTPLYSRFVSKQG
ncbi:MAG: hypothetical protein KKE73_09405 [Proteobacteria bacterium]|nr:hypothetical protein [Pseudomonadota bacterium]